MGIRNGAYATIWEVKPGKGNYLDVRLSTSKKNKQTDKYETDFSGFVRFVGKAKDVVEGAEERTRIKINECELTNHYSKETNTTYYNVCVFDAELTGVREKKPEMEDDGFMKLPDGIDEELPFC